MGVQVTPPSAEDSHLTTEPTFPLKVTEPLDPLHIVDDAEAVPPTVAGSIVNMATELEAAAQLPFCTFAM